EAEAARAARRLAARGVRRGASVVITQPSGLEYVIALHALMKLGAVVHPLNRGLAPAELEAEIERAKPALVLDESDHVTMSEGDPGRRGACPDRRARGGDRSRSLGRADLRHDGDRVPGHDARPFRRPAKAGLRGTAPPDDPPADIRRRDLRPGARGRTWMCRR